MLNWKRILTSIEKGMKNWEKKFYIPEHWIPIMVINMANWNTEVFGLRVRH